MVDLDIVVVVAVAVWESLAGAAAGSGLGPGRVSTTAADTMAAATTIAPPMIHGPRERGGAGAGDQGEPIGPGCS
ncbi:hypothetical protein A7R75_24295 [Mycolicibacterium llatzerense]|nr:hypothetical protein [Mycolicibacterium llatzerense]